MRDTSSTQADADPGTVLHQEIFKFMIADEGSRGAVDIDGQVLKDLFPLPGRVARLVFKVWRFRIERGFRNFADGGAGFQEEDRE